MTIQVKVNPEALATIRAMAGLSLRELAEQAKVGKSYLHDIERGQRVPSPAVARKIARGLGVPFASIFELTPKEPSEKSEGMVARAS